MPDIVKKCSLGPLNYDGLPLTFLRFLHFMTGLGRPEAAAESQVGKAENFFANLTIYDTKKVQNVHLSRKSLEK